MISIGGSELKIHEIKEILDAEVLCGSDKLFLEVSCACGCDLMSDVLKFPKDNSVLITGLNNIHVIRTAEMADIQCLVFARGVVPTVEIITEANSIGMIVMRTNLPLYESCGRLYKEGLGVDKCSDGQYI